jgi:hypothetical protein
LWFLQIPSGRTGSGYPTDVMIRLVMNMLAETAV